MGYFGHIWLFLAWEIVFGQFTIVENNGSIMAQMVQIRFIALLLDLG